MWRARFAVVNDQNDPFKKFIGTMIELDAPHALKLAIDEIDRLKLALAK